MWRLIGSLVECSYSVLAWSARLWVAWQIIHLLQQFPKCANHLKSYPQRFNGASDSTLSCRKPVSPDVAATVISRFHALAPPDVAFAPQRPSDSILVIVSIGSI